MKLHGYYRSSAAFRVRIALNLKQLGHESVAWHLRHGAHRSDAFRAVSPQALVPVLEDGAHTLSQSLAIIEYLDEAYPEPPLLPQAAADRARVRGVAQLVACDIHPINNLRVLKYLRAEFGADESAIERWYNHWISEGFDPLEALLTRDARTGRFCHGDTPGLADIVLIPQMVNARNYALDLARWPTLVRIFDACMALPAFAEAHPDRQSDAE